MILNNHWNYMKAISDNVLNWSSWKFINAGLIDINGVARNIVLDATWNSNYCSMAHNNYAPRSELAFLLGSGTTAPEKTDYSLENDITSSFSNIAFTESSIVSSDDLEITFTITGTNSTASSLTISEIGYVKQIYYEQSFNWAYVMMAREVLNNPITVEPNQNFEIEFIWTER